jgi:hydroxyethylthiazole kinase-like sugar kinase family protein
MKYAKIFHSKALQKYPNWIFLNIKSGNPAFAPVIVSPVFAGYPKPRRKNLENDLLTLSGFRVTRGLWGKLTKL